MEILLRANVLCPYCGEEYETTIDTSQEDFSTIEDCAVCCRPIELSVRSMPGEILALEVDRA
jgi:hypothetical protein